MVVSICVYLCMTSFVILSVSINPIIVELQEFYYLSCKPSHLSIFYMLLLYCPLHGDYTTFLFVLQSNSELVM